MTSSLIVPSSLDYFPAQEPAALNPMHLQPTCTPHLQQLSSRRAFGIQSNSCGAFLCKQ